MDRMTDDGWGNLDDNLRRVEEQEEGIFAEIKRHSEDTIIGSEMTNNQEMCIRDRFCIAHIQILMIVSNFDNTVCQYKCFKILYT